ncbi:hypothetical protein GcM1_131003, partial [Golovinomyces cichoracearum]
MFGSMLSPTDKQKIGKYWFSDSNITTEEKAKNTSSVPQPSIQTSQFVGETSEFGLAPKIPNLPSEIEKLNIPEFSSKENLTLQAPPKVPEIPPDVWPQTLRETSGTITQDLQIVQPTNLTQSSESFSQNNSDYDSCCESIISSQSKSKIGDRETACDREYETPIDTEHDKNNYESAKSNKERNLRGSKELEHRIEQSQLIA